MTHDTGTARRPKPQVDTSRPHPARVYDWFLGGKDNYPVDREVGRSMPEAAKAAAHRNRDFMHRAVAWAARGGIDQFLDIGTGIPTEPNLHQIAQRELPRARVVYVDNDPIVLRHAEALLVSTPEGATDYLQADVRQPADILRQARALLDFDRPVALCLIALLHFAPDDQDPYGIVRELVAALPAGSLLVMSHVTVDEHPELEDQIVSAYREGQIPLRMRGRAEFARFFDGLELVDPGIVTAAHWYREEPRPQPERTGFYVGVARVP